MLSCLVLTLFAADKLVLWENPVIIHSAMLSLFTDVQPDLLVQVLV